MQSFQYLLLLWLLFICATVPCFTYQLQFSHVNSLFMLLYNLLFSRELLVQCIIFDSDIAQYADLLHPFRTYLVSIANIRESNDTYSKPLGDFTWIIDKNIIIEPIEEITTLRNSLPRSTRLAVTPFEHFDHQYEGHEFDILAIVLNAGLPTYAANGPRIQDFIEMDDNGKKSTKLTLWTSFIDHDENKIMEILDQFLIILARKIKQMLPLKNVKTQLTRKTFSIQAKKSFSNTIDASSGKLIVVSFMEKENPLNTEPLHIAMDTTKSSKTKNSEHWHKHIRQSAHNKSSNCFTYQSCSRGENSISKKVLQVGSYFLLHPKAYI
ncbi:hypothetical protein P3L10_021089 [Capsicum annuum]